METPTYQHGLVIGRFEPLHRGHQHLIDQALVQCRNVSILIEPADQEERLPIKLREKWIRELYPQVNLILPQEPATSTKPLPHRIAWKLDSVGLHRIQRSLWNAVVSLRNPLGFIDRLYSSEAYVNELRTEMSWDRTVSAHQIDDLERAAFPLDDEAVYQDIHAHHRWIDPRVYAHFISQITVTGPGHSEIARELASRLGTMSVSPRIDLMTPDGIYQSALKLRQAEEEAARSGGVHRFLINDTDTRDLQTFSFKITGEAHPELVKLNQERRYTRVLVCQSQKHHESNSHILDLLANQQIPFNILRGTPSQQIEQALRLLG